MLKLIPLLENQHKDIGKLSDYTDQTIDRICDILEGNGEQHLRDSIDYRKHNRESKY